MARRTLQSFLRDCVLPMVAGGDIHVGRPLSRDDVATLEQDLPHATVESVAVDEARAAVLAPLVCRVPGFVLEGEDLALAAALHNALFLVHPDAEGVTITEKLRRRIIDTTQGLATQPLTRHRTRVLTRHALLHNVFALTRTDVQLSWWTGRARYLGKQPPQRLLRWRAVRRVREEHSAAGYDELLGAPDVAPVMAMLLRRSPLTMLLSSHPAAPALHWEDAVFVLRDASVTQLGRPVLDLATAGPIGGPAVPSLLDVFIDPADQTLLFVALGLALALRIPLVPLHFWLPAVHAAAPTPLSIVLATGFVQTAAIGLLRFGLPLLPDAARAAGPSIAVLGIVALVYASLVALVQKELRRLVAWSSIGYAGFAVFGIATLDIQGITGAVVQLVTHGLATSALFMLTGFLATRRKTTEVVAFGGLAKPMPVCAFFFGLMTASLMGLPLLGGFVGDLFVLLGSLGTRRELSLVALVAMVVSASYLLWVQRRVFLGPVDEPANRGLIDLDRVERFVMLAITVPIVAIGLYPNPLLRRIEPAVLEILYEMDRRALPEEGEPQDGPPPAEEGAVGGGVARRSDPPRAEAGVAWAIRAPLAGVRR